MKHMLNQKLIVGNWKMNGLSESVAELAKPIIDQSKDVAAEIILCPPATLISTLCGCAKDTGVKIGGQDCHPEEKGAFTGDVSAEMLADLGAEYVIVGHSERRRYHHESSPLVAEKTKAALRAGLIPIVCVGESLGVREAGLAEYTVAAELLVSLPPIGDSDQIIIAYEPLWAIGTGQHCSNKDIAAMHENLRQTLVKRDMKLEKTPILYGGSVKLDNAAEILGQKDVGGVLVGGASLDVDIFMSIIRTAAQIAAPHSPIPK